MAALTAIDPSVLTLAAQIRKAETQSLSSNLLAGDWIRAIHAMPQGAEALRLIVRDNIAGAGPAIIDALWLIL